MVDALERLGYSPIHGGHEVLALKKLYYEYFTNGSFSILPSLHKGNFDMITEMMRRGGWDSAADWPFYFMYDDVLTHWPDSKFVLPLRDSEDWYYSWANLLSSNPILKSSSKKTKPPG
jgi:hypothetical protein